MVVRINITDFTLPQQGLGSCDKRWAMALVLRDVLRKLHSAGDTVVNTSRSSANMKFVIKCALSCVSVALRLRQTLPFLMHN